jgi:hypothetical protein
VEQGLVREACYLVVVGGVTRKNFGSCHRCRWTPVVAQ